MDDIITYVPTYNYTYQVFSRKMFKLKVNQIDRTSFRTIFECNDTAFKYFIKIRLLFVLKNVVTNVSRPVTVFSISIQPYNIFFSFCY